MKAEPVPRCLVTGAAGFIGSTLCEQLLKLGATVRGVDCFSDYYPRWIKERNLAAFRDHPCFELQEVDLLTGDLPALLDEVDCVLHLAAQPGVRQSWGIHFRDYTDNNVLVTQRILEVCKGREQIRKFVYASSSSVYGDSPSLPQREADLCLPVSPYGVTKLAGEQLCYLYCKSFGVPTVILRFFTVYGPRQRPDMAFHRFIKAGLNGERIEVYGSGEQTRDFTYVDDTVRGLMAATENSLTGQVLNLGGGNRTRLREVLALIEEILGTPLSVDFRDTQKGDAAHTLADTTAARRGLGFAPSTSLRDGLEREVAWIRELYKR